MEVEGKAFKLRDYQERCVDNCIKYLDKYKGPGIVVEPTGSGKSIVIAELADRLGNVLVLQPNIELLTQNFEKYQLYSDDGTIFSASAGQKDLGHVTFATIGSIYTKPELFKDYKYLFVDECHLFPTTDSMYSAFLKENPQLKVLGFTATPFKLKRYRVGSKLIMLHSRIYGWKDYANVTQVEELLPYWQDVELQKSYGDLSKLKINTNGSEYTEISSRLYADTRDNDIISLLNSEDFHTAIVYVPSIEQARRLSVLTGSDYLYSGMNAKSRKEIIRRFKKGLTKVIFNVNILSIGFDHPNLDLVIDCNPTLSLARYYQKYGRLVRKSETKTKAKYIDMTGALDKFGDLRKLKFVKHGVNYQGFIGQDQVTNVFLDGEFVRETYVTMPFGKYKGVEFKFIPKPYLSWMKDNIKDLSPDLKSKIDFHLSV